MLWEFLVSLVSDQIGRAVVDLGPTPPITERLEAMRWIDYISVDLHARRKPTVYAKFEQLPLKTASADIVIASHVLEHIRDEALALTELDRVLRPGGLLLVQVPIRRSLPVTLADPGMLTSHAFRARVFGHPGHVRQYGADFCTRLERTWPDQVHKIPPAHIVQATPLERGGYSSEYWDGVDRETLWLVQKRS